MANVRIDGGPSFEVCGSDSILKGALRSSIGFPYECSVGGCGACKFDLLEGEVTTLWDDAPGLSPRDRQRGRRLACQSIPVGDVRIKVRTEPALPAMTQPQVTPVVFEQIRQVTHDMSEFTFRSSAPAQFLAGQYALIQVPGLSAQRAYSMSNLSNSEGLWKFIVRRVPGGQGTRHLFDEMRLGDPVCLDGPYGHASLRPVERDVICIAGGSGLAPMLSIASAAAPVLEPLGRKLHFFFGARTPRDLAAEPLLSSLPGFGHHLRCLEVVSRLDGGDSWSGAAGLVHEAVEERIGEDLVNCEIYFAGPPPMVEATMDMLMVRRRVPFEQIHYDRFF
jgi:toluene monooxygenase electron transfer component